VPVSIASKNRFFGDATDIGNRGGCGFNDRLWSTASSHRPHQLPIPLNECELDALCRLPEDFFGLVE